MPAGPRPCTRCKDRHEKCDDQQPQCRRCAAKGLECHRVAQCAAFRPGSAARHDTRFPKNQKWVQTNQNTISFRVHTAGIPPDSPLSETTADQLSSQSHPSPGEIHRNQNISIPSLLDGAANVSPEASSSYRDVLFDDSPSQPERKRRRMGDTPSSNTFAESPKTADVADKAPASFEAIVSPVNVNDFSTIHSTSPTASTLLSDGGFVAAPFLIPRDVQPEPVLLRPRPLGNVHEATLMRYFIDHLAPWFDLCDEERYFQLVVPWRARGCEPLLKAIFAVSIRHLIRPARYRTQAGISYRDQVFPNLTDHDAVAYMLQCLPALKQFHEIDDYDYRSNLVAAAVVLRQFEEMDAEENSHFNDSTTGAQADVQIYEPVNFLAITKAFLESAVSTENPKGRRLVNAAFWIVLRQEIYFSFTRERCPHLAFGPEIWLQASTPNKLILHTAEVVKWRWGVRSEQEWLRLKSQEAFVQQHYAEQIVPIFQRKANKSQGEIFPTIWYGSHSEVTGIQHFILAKMILVAEDPTLDRSSASRAAHRHAESSVKSLILDLCGIAVHHTDSPPNLVNAALGIAAYGDYFTDEWERKAVAEVVEQLQRQHAWPVRKAKLRLGISDVEPET
ncbi:hypothetical protein F5Y15DRAFT_423000 [Xylariaceae sp. FL0016]|nr:hypothetical protein F5Y15DRAFT_423000 [Xylariaceae sp. FL0016]